MKQILESAAYKRKILVVDDEIINREILGNIFTSSYLVSYASSGEETLEILSDTEQNFSLVLLDLIMPGMNGFEFLDRCAEDERLRRVPVIVMTAERDAEVESIRRGAVDFITKPFEMPEVILARCERIIEMYEDKSIITSIEKDAVTGLYSREFFIEYIRQLTPHLTDEMDAVAINIDHFRFINELFGRKEGNRILAHIAELIESVMLRGEGIACRAEADTFFIFCSTRSDYEEVVSEIQNQLVAASPLSRIHLRAGVYRNVDLNNMAEIWFDWAKVACDRLRGNLSCHVEYYSDAIHARALFHERLISDFQTAIAERHLTVYYQPKYNITNDEPRLSSAEALVRWKHPELGMLSPGEFIPLFESNGLIRQLDAFVWQETAAQIKRWKERFGITVPVSVNVSRVDVFNDELDEQLMDIITGAGLAPSEFMLEITETACTDNSELLLATIEKLRRQGFQIEMDDFGSGYSSLNMLATIPFDVLKLDMAFVRNMFKDEKSFKLVELVMGIAKFLSVPVVAEGVEDEEQLNALKKMGCDCIQGYYFSPPVAPDLFESFIEKELGRRAATGE
jgi:diguanylate cyclase (GGDEF)-like protein